VYFEFGVESGCGLEAAEGGPFYCPTDFLVYLPTEFFVGDIRTQDFAVAAVIAHEVGHHVQNQLGILPKVQQVQQRLDKVEANQVQVRVELQADCLAGVWAHHSQETWNFIEPGDVEAAMQTASAIGDDRLQRQTQGYVVPDAFTHGSSQQRTRWFMTGLNSGKVDSCDTLNAAQL
jgi:predicted metalloprotease